MSSQSNDDVVQVGGANTRNQDDENVDSGVRENVTEYGEEPLDDSKPLSFRDSLSLREEQAKWWCCPHGITKHSMPLFLAALALAFTGYGYGS